VQANSPKGKELAPVSAGSCKSRGTALGSESDILVDRLLLGGNLK